MRINAEPGESELRHVHMAQNDRARAPEPCHDRRVIACWLRIDGQRPCMASERLHVDIGLHRKKLAIQRAKQPPRGLPRGSGLGILQQSIWRNAKEYLGLRVERSQEVARPLKDIHVVRTGA